MSEGVVSDSREDSLYPWHTYTPMMNQVLPGCIRQTRCGTHPFSPYRVDICLDGHARAGDAWTGHLQSIAEPLWICRHVACLHRQINWSPAEGDSADVCRALHPSALLHNASFRHGSIEHVCCATCHTGSQSTEGATCRCGVVGGSCSCTCSCLPRSKRPARHLHVARVPEALNAILLQQAGLWPALHSCASCWLQAGTHATDEVGLCPPAASP